MRKVKLIIPVMLVVLLMMVGACAPKPAPPAPAPAPPVKVEIPLPKPGVTMPKFLKMQGGASPGSGSDIFTAVVLEELAKFFPDTSIRRLPMGTGESYILTNKKEIDLAVWPTAGDVIPMWRGTYKGYEGQKMQDCRVIGGESTGALGNVFYVLDTSPIKSITELGNKKIGVGPRGSASWVLTEGALEAYGITYESIEKAGGLVFIGSITDAAAMLSDGRLDAIAYGLPIPSAMLMPLDLKFGIRALPWGDKAIKHALEKFDNAHYIFPMKAGTYKGVKEDVTTLSFVMYPVVHKDMPDDVVYNITAAFYSPALRKVVPEKYKAYEGIDVIEITKTMVSRVPYHPGAIKYWQDRGITLKFEPLK